MSDLVAFEALLLLLQVAVLVLYPHVAFLPCSYFLLALLSPVRTLSVGVGATLMSSFNFDYL